MEKNWSSKVTTALINDFEKATTIAVDWNMPDYKMREFLANHYCLFEVAKNYDELIQINNLVLNEDGNLKLWHNFKREVKLLIGHEIGELERDYRTFVAFAQMSSHWFDIQRDKHLFPFLEFVVTKDGHTSDICEPLYKVVVSVDDPMLLTYYPPNHFNCRTDVIRLRRGVIKKRQKLPKLENRFIFNYSNPKDIEIDKSFFIIPKTARSLKTLKVHYIKNRSFRAVYKLFYYFHLQNLLPLFWRGV